MDEGAHNRFSDAPVRYQLQCKQEANTQIQQTFFVTQAFTFVPFLQSAFQCHATTRSHHIPEARKAC